MAIPHLTFTRFVAAVIVLIFHFAINGGNHVLPFNNKFLTLLLSHGDLAVPYFFILSGFVMSFAYYVPNRGFINLYKFYVSRFARIYPIYILSLLLYSFIGFTTTVESVQIRNWILNILLIQSWFPDATINLAAWSLSVEMFFYILFPFILFFFQNRTIKEIIFSLLFFLGMYYYYIIIVNKIIFYPLPLKYLPIFIIGVLCGLLFKKIPNNIMDYLTNKINYIFLVLVFLLLILLTLSIVKFNASTSNDFIPVVVFSLLIIAFALDNSFIAKLFSLPFFILLGNISYSIYILQFPLKFWFDHLLMSKLNSLRGGNLYNINFYSFAFFLTSTSLILYYIFEEPIRKYIRKALVSQTTNRLLIRE